MAEIEKYAGRRLDGGNATPVVDFGRAPGLTSPPSYQDQVAAGDVIGGKAVFAPGYNPDIGNTLEDVTESGLAIIPVPAAAITMEVLSSSANDDGSPAGTNAHAVAIHGLSDSFDEQAEILTLDGVTPVATALAYRRINALHVAANAGHGITAAGNIDIRDPGTPANIFSRVGAGGNMSLQAHYTVPRAKTGFITGWQAGAIAAQSIVARIILRATCNWETRGLMSGVFLFQDIMAHAGGTSQREFKNPRRIPSMADIKISAQRMLGATTIQVGCSFELWIEDE